MIYYKGLIGLLTSINHQSFQKKAKWVSLKSDSFQTALNRVFVGPDPNFVVCLMSLQLASSTASRLLL